MVHPNAREADHERNDSDFRQSQPCGAKILVTLYTNKVSRKLSLISLLVLLVCLGRWLFVKKVGAVHWIQLGLLKLSIGTL